MTVEQAEEATTTKRRMRRDGSDDRPERVGLGGLIEQPSFFWASGFAGLAIGLAFWVRELEFGGTESGVTKSQLDNINSGAVVVVCVAAAVWLLFVVQLFLQPAARTLSGGEQLFTELWATCRAMVTYALDRGIDISEKDVSTIQALRFKIDRIAAASDTTERLGHPAYTEMATDCETLTTIHARLALAVVPAMPKTLRLLHDPLPKGGTSLSSTKTRSFEWLGPVRLVRMMVGLVVALIPLFVALSVGVGTRLNRTCGLFAGNSLDKTESVLYLVAASALGAGFAGLFKAFKYIGNLSYDDKYESSYWVRYILGVVAGLILAIIVAQSFFGGPTGTEASCLATAVDAGESTSNAAFQITIPLLALVGGFSSDLVYRILKRVIEAIETLIEGSTSDRIDLENQRAELRSAKQDIANRRALSIDLLAIRAQLPAGSAALARLDKTLADLWGSGPLEQPQTDRVTVISPAVGERTVEVNGVLEIEVDVQPASLAATMVASIGPAGAGTVERVAGSDVTWTFTAGPTPGPAVVTLDVPNTDHYAELELEITEAAGE